MLDRLRGLDSCAVSDALDTLGLPGAVIGLGPLWPVDRVTVGRARTVRAAPRDPAAGSQDHIAASLVAVAEAGDIVVVDNRGRLDVSCWGGILTTAAKARGVAGVVVDGACRDIAESHAADLPVFGRATVPVSARGRIVQEAMDVPVSVAGVAVQSGDYVVADRSGVVFVPAVHIRRVVPLAERIAEREAGMVAAVLAGRSVVGVMHDSKFPSAEDRP